MKRRLVTLHADGKTLNARTRGLLHAVIDMAGEFEGAELSVNADRTLTVLVEDGWGAHEFRQRAR